MASPDDDDLDAGAEDEEEDLRPKGPLYLTPQGAERMRAELKQLLTVERPKVTQEVSHAAALGDRSENAEYIYGKKRLREIDRRLRFLQKRLEQVTVVDPRQQKDTSRVYFGATVTLENEEDGARVTYQLVGADETDTRAGRISIESPVGKALIGRRQDDSVTVSRPRGEVDFTVVAIRYE